MATTPPVPPVVTPPATVAATPVTVPDNHSVISTELQATLASLAAKHVSVSYTLIGVLVLMLLLGGVGAFFANKIYQAEIKRAEAAEQLGIEARKQMEADKVQSNQLIAQATNQLAEDSKQRAVDAQKIATLEQQIKDRDTQSQNTINQILADKTAQQAYADASKYYKLASPLIAGKDTFGNDTLTFQVKDVDDFTATKVGLNTATADLTSKNAELVSSNNQIVSLNADLKIGTAAFGALQKTQAACELTVADDQKTIAAYKKAAHVGKFRRIMGGVLKVAIFVGGVYLGHHL